jgi:effector-binding domain-containing protein
MKKFLRIVLILLGLFITVMLIIGLTVPKDITVSRTATINAPKDAVFTQVVNFKNWKNWSAWYQKDSTAKMTYFGTDGQVGSGYTWAGNARTVGSGTMTMDTLKGYEMMFTLNFTAPREGKANGYFKLDDSGKDATKATWALVVHMAYPFNAMQIFMNMDKMIGDDFATGLANMKKYVESHPTAQAATVNIQDVPFAEHNYVGIRKTVAMSGMSDFFMQSYSSLGKELGPNIVGPASAIYYTWDTVKHNSDMAAVFPVAKAGITAKGATAFHIAAASAYMAVHMGGYAASVATHTALGKHLAQNGKKMSYVIEEYIKGPNEEKDSTKWVTNIYYIYQ